MELRFYVRMDSFQRKQVNVLISKNKVLQLLYFVVVGLHAVISYGWLFSRLKGGFGS